MKCVDGPTSTTLHLNLTVHEHTLEEEFLTRITAIFMVEHCHIIPPNHRKKQTPCGVVFL